MKISTIPKPADVTNLWKPLRITDYWQCATPTGPYTFRADSETQAKLICDCERMNWIRSRTI